MFRNKDRSFDTIAFDKPTKLADAINQYLQKFEPTKTDDTVVDWTHVQKTKRANKLRQIKNILTKPLSTEKKELMKTKYKEYNVAIFVIIKKVRCRTAKIMQLIIIQFMQ